MHWPDILRPFLRWLSGEPAPSDDPMLEAVYRRFARITRSLSRSALSADTSSAGVSIADMLEHSGSGLFLGMYSAEGIRYAFEQLGIVDGLAKRGLIDLVFEVVPRGRFRHHFRLFCDGGKNPENLVAELVVRLENQPASVVGVDARGLSIEWILLQNPKAEFPPHRPPLPGQKHPGLGLGREALSLLALVTNRLELDGMWSIPDHLHNAMFYSVRFQFADPAAEGRFRALLRDLGEHSVGEIAWAAARQRLLDVATGKPLEWPLGLQVAPRSESLQAYYRSNAYRESRDQVCAQARFVIDWSR